ncbi:hypothetical protein WHR41_02064 [Cladosporium halotolerans]|uniref:Chromosome segregation in meiosis protein n=1 Tax=Cladosporium halotolerans TaxID=1052096 RepID=A0AB34L0D6_9PEZI
MPSATSPLRENGAGGQDDLDNLLDFDGAVEDFWKDLPDTNGDNANTINAPQDEKDIDEEVKVTKKRKPNPKLDEDRLLSTAGIPKLRRVARDRLRLKGKGHEFSDMQRMLELYQLWLDELYPKAKFRDALTMVEKVGHTRRMQVSRRAWIDESKSYRRREDEDAERRLADPTTQAAAERDDIFPQQPAASNDNARQQNKGADAPDDDELDALLGEEPTPPNRERKETASGTRQGAVRVDDDGPDEDELDALLNDDAAPPAQPSTSQSAKRKGPFEDDEDDGDELNVLLAKEHKQDHVHPDRSSTLDAGKHREDEPNFADDEEAMAEMGW